MRHIGRTYLVVNKGQKKTLFRKNDLSGKKFSKKKIISMVLTEIDPAPLWRQI